MGEAAGYSEHIIGGYEKDSARLIPAYRQLPPETVLSQVSTFLPAAGTSVLDIGAGIGTIAAWLADRGCSVTAVEPVESFRSAGRNSYPHHDIIWQDDCLPTLPVIRADSTNFDTILAIGVFHHLTHDDQLNALATLSHLLRRGGKMILSLRHGACPPSRLGFPIWVDDILGTAQQDGLNIVHHSHTDSIQPGNRRAGVTWTWLVFGAP